MLFLTILEHWQLSQAFLNRAAWFQLEQPWWNRRWAERVRLRAFASPPAAGWGEHSSRHLKQEPKIQNHSKIRFSSIRPSLAVSSKKLKVYFLAATNDETKIITTDVSYKISSMSKMTARVFVKLNTNNLASEVIIRKWPSEGFRFRVGFDETFLEETRDGWNLKSYIR